MNESKIYHITRKENIPYIKKNGLVPTRGNLTSTNLEREKNAIYFWGNYKDCMFFLSNVLLNHGDKCIVVCDLNRLKNKKYKYNIYPSRCYKQTLQEVAIYNTIPFELIDKINFLKNV